MMILLEIILCGILAMVIHEGGHSLVCFLLTGKFLKFHFRMGTVFYKIKVPRFLWNLPSGLNKVKLRILCMAGFTFEMLAILVFYFFFNKLLPIYTSLVILHFFIHIMLIYIAIFIVVIYTIFLIVIIIKKIPLYCKYLQYNGIFIIHLLKYLRLIYYFQEYRH